MCLLNGESNLQGGISGTQCLPAASRARQKHCIVAHMTRATFVLCKLCVKPGSRAVSPLLSVTCFTASSAERRTPSLQPLCF